MMETPVEDKSIIPDISGRGKTPVINFARETSLYFPSEVEIAAADLGTDAWQQMIDETQKDKRERGFELTLKNGKVKRSAVYKGDEHSFLTPPRELVRQFLKRERMVGSFHTHYFDETVDTKAPTGTFSLRDFNTFANLPDSKVMGMLDIGGVHILMKGGLRYSNPPALPQGNFVLEAIRQTRETNGVMLDALKKIAGIAERSSMTYYFAPSLAPDSNGLIKLKNIKAVDYIPPRPSREAL